MSKNAQILLFLLALPSISLAQSVSYAPPGSAGAAPVNNALLSAKWPAPGAAIDDAAQAPVDPNAAPGSVGGPGAVGTVNAPAASAARPPVESPDALAEAWSNDPQQKLRQSGGSLPRPDSRGIWHSSQASDRDLLKRWKKLLMDEGMSAAKIDFESKRLDRGAFELWASRHLWHEQRLHPNVVQDAGE